jgi:hypothetical protein
MLERRARIEWTGPLDPGESPAPRDLADALLERPLPPPGTNVQQEVGMRHMRYLALAVALSACASASGVFPEAGDAQAAIGGAERMISEAQQAGADSLAAEAMTSARNNLAAARAAGGNRAALLARQAQADARFARAEAERVRADRARTEAAAALRAITSPGGGR